MTNEEPVFDVRCLQCGKLYPLDHMPKQCCGQDFAEYVEREKKIGRNEPCPCGSGKKYKRCCMDK